MHRGPWSPSPAVSFISHHIRLLLKNVKATTCVLADGDDEVDVGENDDTSEEVAGAGSHTDGLRERKSMHGTEHVSNWLLIRKPGK